MDKPPARSIPVRTVRRALSFFGSTSADGGERVCIVDAAEDLLPAAANALLKTIEEPPARSTILIVSHAPQRLLPTIRSRCRKLSLSPLSDAEVEAVLETLGPETASRATALRRAAALSEGSVRRALSLLDAKRLATIEEVGALLDGLPSVPTLRVLALAEKLADRKGSDDLPVALDAVRSWAAARVRARAGEGAARLAPLASLWDRIDEAARSVETFNLDRRPFVVAMFADLAEAVGHSG